MAVKKKTQAKTEQAEVKHDEERLKAAETIDSQKNIMSGRNVPLRRFPGMEQKYVIGTMPANTAFKIYKEVSNMYGSFYLLGNGAYISKNDGPYTIY